MLFILLVFLSAAVCAGEVVLVENGVPKAVIVLEANPTRAAQLGAFELNHHIRLITGAELPVVRGKKPADRFAVIIGGSGTKFQPGETVHITFAPGEVRLDGFDTTTRRTVNYADFRTFPPVSYYFKTPLFAVYEFLEYHCQVRFYGFGDGDTCHPVGKTLKIKTVNRVSKPACDAFRELWAEYFSPSASPDRRTLALWRLRQRMSSNFGYASHNEYTIYYAHWGEAAQPALKKSFRGKRPELFAQKPLRRGIDPVLAKAYPNDPDVPSHLCYTHPETIDFHVRETLTYLRGRTVPGGWCRGRIPVIPGIPFYYPVHGSDIGVGHCRCPRCLRQFSDGTPEGLSKRKFQFVSDLARKAAKLDPRAGICTLAYCETYAYPHKVSLADNLSVTVCPVIFSWWHPTVRERQSAMLKIWLDREAKKRPVGIWSYLYAGGALDSRFHYGNYLPFPDVYPWKAGEIIRQFVRDGVRGLFLETDVTYCRLEGYVAMKLAWNPELDPDALIDEFFARYYGPAGDAMKRIWKKCETIYWNAAKYRKYLAPEANKDGIASPKGKRSNFWTTGLIDLDTEWAGITRTDMEALDALAGEALRCAVDPVVKRRVKNFTDHIWVTAKRGFFEYELIQKHKTQPLRMLPVATVRPGENPDSAFRNPVPAGQNWTRCLGQPSQSKCQVKAVCDGQKLYLELIDPDGWFTGEKTSRYHDTFEVFLRVPGQPLRQFCAFPDGTSLTHEYTEKMRVRDLGAVIRGERMKNGVWRVRIDLPLHKLGLEKQSSCLINFARVKGREILVWNPIFTTSLLAGADNAGVLGFPMRFEDDVMKGDKCPDPAAGDGRAARMPVNRGWSVTMVLKPSFHPGKYRAKVWVRSDAPTGRGLRHNIGFYSAAEWKKDWKRNSVFVPVNSFAGPVYREIDLGVHDLKPGMMFFISGIFRTRSQDTQLPNCHLYCDRLELIPQ